MEKLNALGNIEIDDKHVLFSINPKIYPLEVVYSAAYILIDKAFIILDGDPAEEILVEIRKKKVNQDLKELLWQFNEELLNYSVYKVQSEKNKNLREIILQRILMTNSPATPEYNPKYEQTQIDDPEGIMKEWQAPRENDRKNTKPE